jgi:hypothetical protein
MDRGMVESEVVGDNGNRKILKYLEYDLSQCQFVYHKCHMDWPEIEPMPVW